MTDTFREDTAEAAAIQEALSRAALPPPGDEERRVVEAGAGGVLRSWRRGAARRRATVVGLSAMAAAAAVALFAASPWLVRRGAPSARRAPQQVAWQLPDLDAAWQAAALVDPDAAGGAPEDPGGDEVDPLFAELAEIEVVEE